jgi:hypothetical protein
VVAVLRERGRDKDLALLLERAHPVLVDAAGAAEQHHRPVVLLGVGESGQGVDDPGPADDEAGLRAAEQVAGGLRGVRRGLLVAHPDERDAGLLGGHRDRHDGEADDAEHVVDALLLEAAGDEAGATAVCHVGWSFRSISPTFR